MPDHAAPVDQVGHSTWQQPECLGDAVPGSDFAIAIREQQERKSEAGGEAAVRFFGIGADADDLRPCLLEDLMTVPKRTGLCRTAGGIVLGIEEQDHVRLAPEIARLTISPVADGKVKSGARSPTPTACCAAMVTTLVPVDHDRSAGYRSESYQATLRRVFLAIDEEFPKATGRATRSVGNCTGDDPATRTRDSSLP